jgi:tetratricopeptide (TPR) repeat protein
VPTLEQEETILHDIQGGKPVSLEGALLVLSGLQTDAELRSYQNKIDDIFGRFLHKCDHMVPSDPSISPSYLHRSIAKCLFAYLWNSKPKRFGEHFLLTHVIDAQLNPDAHHLVGTCVGLTSLYSVLGLRAGLDLSLLMTLDHLLSRLRVGPQTIDIDHTDPQGFGRCNREDFREFPLPMLIANVLNCRGLRSETNGEMATAKADYQKALMVNPKYANAFNNRGNMRFLEEDAEGAVADYTEAIRLHPGFCEAYCNRGMAKHRLGRYEEARQDQNKAMSLNSDYSDARRCLRILNDLVRPGPPAGEAPCRSSGYDRPPGPTGVGA